MAHCTSLVRFLGPTAVGGLVASLPIASATESKERALWGPSVLQRARRPLQKMAIMKEALQKMQERYAHDMPMMKDRDMAVEIFLENGKMKTPYNRVTGWEPTTFARWQHPDCTPGIGSRVYTDDPMTDAELAAALALSLKTGKVANTGTRPYILVVYGNDQYVSVYPDFEEIGPDHPHRQKVERHFRERGLDFIEETIPINWDKIYGQGSSAGNSGLNPGQPGLTPGFTDEQYFRVKLFTNLGIPSEFFLPQAPICHSPPEGPKKTENLDGGKPTG